LAFVNLLKILVTTCFCAARSRSAGEFLGGLQRVKKLVSNDWVNPGSSLTFSNARAKLGSGARLREFDFSLFQKQKSGAAGLIDTPDFFVSGWVVSGNPRRFRRLIIIGQDVSGGPMAVEEINQPSVIARRRLRCRDPRALPRPNATSHGKTPHGKPPPRKKTTQPPRKPSRPPPRRPPPPPTAPTATAALSPDGWSMCRPDVGGRGLTKIAEH